MKNAIILHAYLNKEKYYDFIASSRSNAYFIPWLQGQLLKHYIRAAISEVPNAYHLDWKLWCKEVKRFNITPETIVVGYNCGVGFWLRWLSEYKDVKLVKVVLVAPSLDYGWDGDFFFENFRLDLDLTKRTKITIFNSYDDCESIQKAVKEIPEKYQTLSYREFYDYKHFTIGNMKTTEIPELFEELLA